MIKRIGDRQINDSRKLTFRPGVTHPSHISVITELGNTIVLCGVSVTDNVPFFLRGSGKGWLTSEYAMLPLSSDERIFRDRQKVNSRSVEIQRLIGRSLRTMVDLSLIGERTIYVDCDVLAADGGTRTAAITGASVAIQILFQRWIRENVIPANAFKLGIAALSFGVVDGQVLVDLDYSEDSIADADVNLVMSEKGDVIELQATAERAPISRQQMDQILEVGHQSLMKVFNHQKDYLQQVN